MFDCIEDVSQYLLRLYKNIVFNISPVIFSDANADRASTPSTDLNRVLGQKKMKKVNKQCLLDTPRTVRVSEKT